MFFLLAISISPMKEKSRIIRVTCEDGISEACMAASESKLEGTDLETVLSDPDAFGNHIQDMAESFTECRE
jgi:hypothetical protein